MCSLSKLKLLDAVLLIELINTAAGINELLLAGVEGMALGADLDGDAGTGGAGLDGCAASALDNGGLIVRMDSCLHCSNLLVIGCLEHETWLQDANWIVTHRYRVCKLFLIFRHKNRLPGLQKVQRTARDGLTGHFPDGDGVRTKLSGVAFGTLI